jgi:hypothetical protein
MQHLPVQAATIIAREQLKQQQAMLAAPRVSSCRLPRVSSSLRRLPAASVREQQLVALAGRLRASPRATSCRQSRSPAAEALAGRPACKLAALTGLHMREQAGCHMREQLDAHRMPPRNFSTQAQMKKRKRKNKKKRKEGTI